MKLTLTIVQIVSALLLCGSILLQQQGTALGSSFGQESGFYATKRGLQKKLVWITAVLVVIFIGSAIANLVF